MIITETDIAPNASHRVSCRKVAKDGFGRCIVSSCGGVSRTVGAKMTFFSIDHDAGAPFAGYLRHSTVRRSGRLASRSIGQIEGVCCRSDIASAVIHTVAVSMVDNGSIRHQQAVHVCLPAIHVGNGIKRSRAEARAYRLAGPRPTGDDVTVGGIDKGYHTKRRGNKRMLATYAEFRASPAIAATACVVPAPKAASGSNDFCSANAVTNPVCLAPGFIAMANRHGRQMAKRLAGNVFDLHAEKIAQGAAQ